MKSAVLRQQIEEALSNRIPSALSIKPDVIRERVPCGISEIDTLIQGGFPVGAITELVGAECSGRTTAALSFLSGITSSGKVCAWVDVTDSLDPESAAANGVDLEKLLWVRVGTGHSCQTRETSKPNASQPLRNAVPPVAVRGSGSCHPRSEAKGMSGAVHNLFQAQSSKSAVPVKRKDKSIGTPSMPNRFSQAGGPREEQIASDRLPPRRGENALPAQGDTGPKPLMLPEIPAKQYATTHNTPWDCLNTSIKATDLLLQGGGFSAIVLDLASTAPEFAWRIPLATWFRFRAACERSRTSLILLTKHPCARSSAELVMRMRSGHFKASGNVIFSVQYHAEVDRQRFKQEEKVVSIRKPPQRETLGTWHGKAAWTRSN